MNKLDQFPYKHVLVLGLAKSGTAAAETLVANNLHVRVNDYKTKRDDPIIGQLEAKGVEVIVGSHPLSVLDEIDVIVKNPGIPYDNPVLVTAMEQDIPIITEIELAANLARNHSIIGVTGSNGKTTTTTLVEEMLKKSLCSVQLAGNIGVVATEVAEELKKDDRLLLELSSFQLMGTQKFRPHVAALLNLHAAHLDYHGTFEHYMTAKANICKNQTEEDFFVYNADDERVCQIAEQTNAQLVPFSVHKKQIEGAWVDQTTIYFKNQVIISRQDVVLVGEHNLENVLAAICIAMTTGATVAGMKQVLSSFSGVKHRLQFVQSIHERTFYNDSKATNMLATEKALQSFTKPTILLAGGLDRGDTFRELIPFLANVKAMIVFGETKHILQELAHTQGIKTEVVEDVSEAVKTAYKQSSSGDVILLSPACASWDQYKTFEERGDMFINSVHKLALGG